MHRLPSLLLQKQHRQSEGEDKEVIEAAAHAGPSGT